MNGLCLTAIVKQLVKSNDVEGLTVRRAAGHKAAANVLRGVNPKLAFTGGIVGRLMHRAAANKKTVTAGPEAVGIR